MDIEKLKQKILDLAIRGKLVPQDPNDEPASVLIEKIRTEKEALIKQGKIKRDKNESYIFKGDDNSYYEKVGGKITKIEVSFEIPSNWSWARLTQIIDVRDGTHDSPKYIKSGIPFVTCKNLKNGTIDYSSCKYISEADAIKINMRSNVDDGDILFAMIGTIGNPVVVKKEFDFCIKNVALLKNIDINCLNNFWLKAFIEYYSDTMKRQTSSGLQPFVSLEFIRNLIIPVPPYIEQCKILHKMERIMEIVLLIQKETVKTRKLVEILKFKILDSIFSENSRYKSYYKNELKLGNILKYEQPAKYIVNSTNYSDDFATPVLTPGKTFILGYTNEKEGIYKVNGEKVIIFDDFTTASRLVDFNFKVKSSAMKILTISNQELFDIEYMYLLLQTIHVNNNTHKRYWISDFATRKVKIHTIQEQTLIVKEIKKLYSIIEKVVG